MDLIGTIFENKYEVIGVLGKGGMSTVYLARDIKLQKLWAIKQIRKENESRGRAKIDLMAETNILQKLDHPALPRIVDIIKRDDSIFVILDFIDGISLDKQLQEYGIADEDTVISWAKQVCDVLIYLHSQKPNPIIYRDMKPGNLMLTSQGKIKLIDFGIAREYKEDVSKDTTYIGTKGYAAPEQYGSNQTDARTDIYSLGVTLYHLATGKGPNDPPFEIKFAREVNPLLSEGFEIIIAKCTQQDPARRYQSAAELLYDLENIHKLNSKYKSEVRVKLLKVCSVMVAFIISGTITVKGIGGIKNENKRQYYLTISQGNELQNLGSTNKAISIYENALNQNANNVDAYIKIIDTYLQMNQYDDITDFVQTNINKSPSIRNNDRILCELGLVYFQKENYNLSYKYFSEIKNPDSVGVDALKYYKPIAQALGGNQALTTNDEIVKSVKELEKYIDTNSDANFKINSYLILAGIYRDNPEVFSDKSNSDKTNTDKQIDVLEKADVLCVNKNNLILYDQLGKAYYDKAEQLKQEPERRIVYLNKALSNYKSSIAAGSKISDSYLNLSNIYKYLGNYDSSESTLIQETQLYPNDYKGYMELALLCWYIEDNKIDSSKNYDNFVKYYNITTQKNPNTNDLDYKILDKNYNSLKDKGIIK